MVATKYGHYNGMPFDDVEVKIGDDTEGRLGRSATRNQLVKSSDADWLFFLDADDMMHPEALVNVGNLYKDYDAFWGLIIERAGQWLELQRTQVPAIRSYEELLEHDPTMTLQIGHFVRREVALAHPFDESMQCGEDWAYYLPVWREHKCIKVAAKFMINIRGQHSTGQKSATGNEWGRAVRRQLTNARNALKEKVA